MRDVFLDCLQGGMTPLHYACANESATVDLLQYVNTICLGQRESPQRSDMRGWTPLHHICANSAASKELVQCVYEFDKSAAKAKSSVRYTLSRRCP